MMLNFVQSQCLWYEMGVPSITSSMSLPKPWGGGEALVFKGGYDAHTRKQLKRVFFFFFFSTFDVRRYLKKGVKNSKILRKKGYVFQPLKL